MEWQPIETAPQEQNILVYGIDWFKQPIITGAIKTEYGWDVLGVGGYDWETEIEPTHWMPLPDAPK